MKLADERAKSQIKPLQQPHGELWAQVALALSMLLSSLGVSIANAALPTLAKAFGASFPEVQWIVLAYLLAVTVLIVSVGGIGDILGRRRVLLAGILLYSTASLLCGLAPTLRVLIAARAVQGIGGATAIALSLALVSEIVAKDRIGRTMGLLGTTSAVGTALGPSLSGLLIAGLGWRAIFIVLAPLGILNFYLVFRYLPFRAQEASIAQGRFDRLGTLLLGLTLALYAFAVTAKSGHLDRHNLALLLAAVGSGGLFLLVEKKATTPLIRLESLRDGALSASLAMNAIVSTVMMSTLVIGPLYLSRALGLEQTLIGLIMSVGPGMSILSGVPAGRLVDRLGAPRVATMGLLEMAVGTISLILLPSMFGVAGYVLAVALLSPGYQLFLAANSTSVMTGVSSEQRGVVSGMLGLSRNLGLITGASVMGTVFSFASKTTQIATARPGAVASGMQMTFTVSTALLAVALCIAFRVRAQATPPLRNK